MAANITNGLSVYQAAHQFIDTQLRLDKKSWVECLSDDVKDVHCHVKGGFQQDISECQGKEVVVQQYSQGFFDVTSNLKVHEIAIKVIGMSAEITGEVDEDKGGSGPLQGRYKFRFDTKLIFEETSSGLSVREIYDRVAYDQIEGITSHLL